MSIEVEFKLTGWKMLESPSQVTEEVLEPAYAAIRRILIRESALTTNTECVFRLTLVDVKQP